MLKEITTDKRKSPLGIASNIWLWERVEKNINFEKLNKYLLEFEKELLKKPPVSDGGTGAMGVTSRFPHYNLFLEDNIELKKVENFIIKNVKSFLELKRIEQRKVYIQCWFNVLRDGEQIKTHQHRNSDDFHLSYISGNFSTTNNNTKTYYMNLNNKIVEEVSNEEGKLTLFPSYLPHFSGINESKKERISIAFDIYPDVSFINPKFIDSGIIKQMVLE